MRSHHDHPILHYSSSTLLLLLSLLLFLLLNLSNCSAPPTTTLPCNGSIAECGHEEDLEMQMESEINRRLFTIQKPRFVGYPALNRDQVPFQGLSGQPYSRKLPARTYSRGCTPIYLCRATGLVGTLYWSLIGVALNETAIESA
ncbi:hypothetical protein Sjap_009069 [Stephania japonica]|uniref:Uncharacterized protein n=1 Tax=Stephania japonica TaxID=461633 RepID=A0AAP0PF81_9MAGN